MIVFEGKARVNENLIEDFHSTLDYIVSDPVTEEEKTYIMEKFKDMTGYEVIELTLIENIYDQTEN